MTGCEIGDFQSFIEVNMGLCVAYLALPRFRYQRRIQEAFLHFHKEKEACIAQYQHRKSKKGEKGEQKNEDPYPEVEDKSAFLDAYLTEITKEEKRFGENEYGSWFFKHYFKPKTGLGMDQLYVSMLVIILFILLSITTIWPKYPASHWVWLFVGCGYFSFSFIALFLIKSGIRHTSNIEILLEKALSSIKATYSIDQPEASISEMIKRFKMS